jgi:hypothetical protein
MVVGRDFGYLIFSVRIHNDRFAALSLSQLCMRQAFFDDKSEFNPVSDGPMAIVDADSNLLNFVRRWINFREKYQNDRNRWVALRCGNASRSGISRDAVSAPIHLFSGALLDGSTAGSKESRCPGDSILNIAGQPTRIFLAERAFRHRPKEYLEAMATSP